MTSEQTLESFFYKAMRHGYARNDATDPETDTIPELPGSKMIQFIDGDFRLVDCWMAGPSGRSCGHTTIFINGAAAWAMFYWGEYTAEATAILKFALAAEYVVDRGDSAKFHEFTGCRGPRLLAVGKRTYVNTPGRGGSFREFSGYEEVIDTEPNSDCRGWHRYEGYILF